MSILRNYSLNIGASLCVLLATLASPAGAAIVFDNGGPNTSNGWSVLGSNSTADNFSIASNTTIGSVGFYFQNYNGIAGWNQDIQYAFLADSGGSPGSVLASGAGQNVVAVDSGQAWCCGGGNAYLVTFNLAEFLQCCCGHSVLAAVERRDRQRLCLVGHFQWYGRVPSGFDPGTGIRILSERQRDIRCPGAGKPGSAGSRRFRTRGISATSGA